MREHENIWKGIFAGAVAGLAASWAMTQFQNSWSQMQKTVQDQSGQQQRGESEDATMKAAEAIGHDVLHVEVSKEEKQKYAPVIHYLFGTATGAIYGALAERHPAITNRWGTEYASLVFLTADELAVPALKLSKPPTQTPLASHIYGWASHLVYGASAESARRIVRKALGNGRKSRLSETRATRHAAGSGS